MTQTHYERLQVAENAQPSELYDAWQAELERVRAASEPGIAQAVALAEVNEAYRLLADGDRRAAYDRKLAARRAESSPPGEDAEGDAGASGFAESRLVEPVPGGPSRSMELDPGSLPDQRAPGQDSNWLTPPELQEPADPGDAAAGNRPDTAATADLEAAPLPGPITPAPNPTWMRQPSGPARGGAALWLRVAAAFVLGAGVGVWGWIQFGPAHPAQDAEFEAELPPPVAAPKLGGADARVASGQVVSAGASAAALAGASGVAAGLVAAADASAALPLAGASAAPVSTPLAQAHRAWLALAAAEEVHFLDGEGLSLGDAWLRDLPGR